MSEPSPTLYSWRTRHPDAQLVYIRDADTANREIQRLSPLSAVGFDQEWKPVFSKATPDNPVALIQLATPQRILLVQISAMNILPDKLCDLLEDSDIVKAGVGIQHDVQKLFKDHQLCTKNCVDLSLLARTVDNPRWKGKYSAPIGLARLVEAYESESLSKGKITRSNWEASLSQPQQEYAANDAHASLTIYTRLSEMAKSMSTPPNTAYFSFDCIRGRLCEPSGAQWYPWNPEYDPGPPPPPKPPKPPKLKPSPASSTPASSTPTATPATTSNSTSSSGQTSIFAKSISPSLPRSMSQTGPGAPGAQNNSAISHHHHHRVPYRPTRGHLGLGPPASEEVEGQLQLNQDASPSSQRGTGYGRTHAHPRRGRGRGRGRGPAFAHVDHPTVYNTVGPSGHPTSRPRRWRPRSLYTQEQQHTS